jgi:hypothetical protein
MAILSAQPVAEDRLITHPAALENRQAPARQKIDGQRAGRDEKDSHEEPRGRLAGHWELDSAWVGPGRGAAARATVHKTRPGFKRIDGSPLNIRFAGKCQESPIVSWPAAPSLDPAGRAAVDSAP